MPLLPTAGTYFSLGVIPSPSLSASATACRRERLVEGIKKLAALEQLDPLLIRAVRSP